MCPTPIIKNQYEPTLILLLVARIISTGKGNRIINRNTRDLNPQFDYTNTGDLITPHLKLLVMWDILSFNLKQGWKDVVITET